MVCVARLTRGADLLNEIKTFCEENGIVAGVILSSVGCVSCAKIRVAGGKDIVEKNEPLEIISLNGTVSCERTHLHVAFSKTDLSVVGGHLVDGCVVNTTAEIVIMEIERVKFRKEFDPNTGYNELKIETQY